MNDIIKSKIFLFIFYKIVIIIILCNINTLNIRKKTNLELWKVTKIKIN